MRIEIPFIGGAYSGRSLNVNAQVCQNLFPIIDQQGGKSVVALMGTPGAKLWSTTGGTGEVRGLCVWGGWLFAVIGSGLYRVGADANASSVGTLSTSTGKVWMAGGMTHLCLVDGESGYYRSEHDTSLTKIADADFPVPSSLTYQDGYFIVTEKDTDNFCISSSEDASSWAGLDFAAAEDTPDDVLMVISHRRELWLAGEETTEVFYNSGNVTYPFTRVAGAVLKIGCGAPASVASSPAGLFMLDNHFRVSKAQGYELIPISTEQVEYHINSYTTKSDAVGYCYSQEGHDFYVLTFPSASRTWVYDDTTGFWHTRSTGLSGGRHFSSCAAFFDGKVIVGHHADGNLYELDLNTYTDNGDPIRSVRASQPVQAVRGILTFGSFELEFESGIGLVTGQGSDPQAMLDWSDDGGHTWGNEHWTDIGAIGNYKTRCIWRRLGSSRNRIFRVTITDPVKRVIIGAHLEGQKGARG